MKLSHITIFFFFVSCTVSYGNPKENEVIKISLSFEESKRLPNNFFPHKEIQHPRIGLALSGGGGRGFAHIGVLKALEEAGIAVDYIAGTSIGSVIGGMYAIGYTPDEISKLSEDIDWDEIYSDAPRRVDLFLSQKQEETSNIMQFRFDGFKPQVPKALSAGQKLSSILNNMILQSNYNLSSDFDQLDIPYRSVTTDIITGDKVVLDHGDMSQAMLASIAVPLLFSPVEIDGLLLIDGGLTDNIPTDIILEMGADLVIASNTISPFRTSEQLGLPWEQADQVITIMQQPVNERLLTLADVIIEPDINVQEPTNFTELDETIESGYRKTVELVPYIQAAINKLETPNSGKSFLISQVRFLDNTIYTGDELHSLIESGSNSVVTELQIKKDLCTLYETGYFKDVVAYVYPNNDKTEIHFKFTESPNITGLEIHGNEIFSDSTIMNFLETRPGKPFNYKSGENDIQNILKFYRERNYSLAQIRKTTYDDITGILTVEIDEGIIGSIVPEGNDNTRNHVILREFPLKEGEVFNFEKAQQGIRNIFSTGLFQRVYLSVSGSNSHPQIHIRLSEKKYLLTRIGARYDRERKAQGILEVQHDNMFGIGAKTNFRFRYGSRDLETWIKIRTDRVFNSYFNYDFSYRLNKTLNYFRMSDHESGEYRLIRVGGVFSIGRQMARFGTVTIETRIERIKTITWPKTNFNEIYDLRAITFRSIIDTKDDYPFPMGGNYYHLYYERAGKIFGGTMSYTKVFASFENFYTLSSWHTFHPRVTIGTADETLPFAERFHLGGDRTLFGIREDILHGRFIFNGSMEYRYKMKKKNYFDSYLSIRYGIGNVWSKTQKLNIKRMRHAFGISFAIDLPIGPLEFSYGRLSAKEDRFYFSLGKRF